MISEVAIRYARALYELAKSNNQSDRVFAELRVLHDVLAAEKAIHEFMSSPVVPPDQKIEALVGCLKGKASEEVLNLLGLLAEKNRLSFFEEIVRGYEAISDEAHGVTRGEVASAAALNLDERHKIEETVRRATGKKVILNFEEDPSLLGGMIARVGGWTFDDSLKSHLVRLNEDLNRRAHS